MNINEFVALFAEQFSDPTETNFAPETKFHELSGWTSMTALLVITVIEENFSVLLSSDEFRNVQTIQELYDLIQEKKG
ncbi:acyl carrier protein [Fibrobacter sp. HC4]|uniref:acyl carrier protein n=1 Tax=Fibrobacter sp. HC4 TaxID=3239812 RepID=UPI002018C1B6|nr:phosphopantetheine-binding protein [Fibrobacter succinogenes]MCL4100568.1 hypothetical protein [Fibrobacter succinogenes]